MVQYFFSFLIRAQYGNVIFYFNNALISVRKTLIDQKNSTA